MKHLAMIMAVILGIIPGVTSSIIPTPAHADQQVSGENNPKIAAIPLQNSMPTIRKLQHQDIADINFTIRVFLWAVDRRQSEILSKITSDVFRSEFSDSRAMMIALFRVHAPVIGAKRIFIYTPNLVKKFAVQTVYVDDRYGNSWKATYLLLRNEQGRYGIAGFFIKKLTGEFT